MIDGGTGESVQAQSIVARPLCRLPYLYGISLADILQALEQNNAKMQSE